MEYPQDIAIIPCLANVGSSYRFAVFITDAEYNVFWSFNIQSLLKTNPLFVCFKIKLFQI